MKSRFFPLILLSTLILAGCQHSSHGPSPSTPKVAGNDSALPWEQPGIPMVQRLKMYADDSYTKPGITRYLNHERAEILKGKLASATDIATKTKMATQLALELLNAGETEDAIKAFADAEPLLRQGSEDFSKVEPWLRSQQAIAYLRLGEQQNCCANNNLDSCLLPIQGQGIHTKQFGARMSIKLLEGMLKNNPKDLQSRWLLNIAYMTVGDYPGKVPPQWRIKPEAFKSDYDIKRFPNVAPNMGLNILGVAGAVSVEDFDGDGNLDIMVSIMGLRDQMHYFHNNGNGTFTDRTKEAGLIGEVGGLNMVTADYNNDGHPDVFILRGGWWGARGHIPSSLLKNNGDGTFTDVTEEAGLLRFSPTQTASWFDYNNDGFLDLFIGNETTPGEVHPCELYRNNGDGTFTECAAQNNVAFVGFVKASVAGDFNNDGRPDLYLSVLNGPNVLYRNDGPAGADKSGKGPWKFTNVAEQAHVTEPISSFPCMFFDYDNDGWLDLFVSGYNTDDVGTVAASYLGIADKAEHPRLYHNNHDGTFTDVTKQTHVGKVRFGMGINYGDLDNDGWLDFYLGTGNPFYSTLVPNYMMRNAGGKYFQDVTTSGDFGDLQKGHGIAFADINNDGQQDVFEQMGGLVSGDTAHSVLFANPGHPGHWITLKLEGMQTNKSAIGARIKVTVTTPAGSRDIYKSVCTGGSFGASPLRQEIGLGNATAIKQVTIFWPTTGKTQVVTGLTMDRFYNIREGDPQAVLVPLKSFKWFSHVGDAPEPMKMN